MSSVDAERVIKAGGVYINHRRVTEADYVLIPGEHILPNNVTLVRVGKCIRGFAKKKIPKIRDYMYYGSGWVGDFQVSLGFFSFFRKWSQNSPKPVLIFWRSIPCVFCLYICIANSCWLLRFECSVHVSGGFPKKVWMGVGGWGELHPIFFVVEFF